MVVYDDKTNGVTKAGEQLFLTEVMESEDIIFKASFVISSKLQCDGKITALFDLFVMGDVEANDIDVKGRFICTGNCIVHNSLNVQMDIWAEDIQAETINCHERIMAQSVDVSTVKVDGNIIVGKTLAVEKRAESFQIVICGETAFGSGKIAASKILTSEPLDLDEGINALEEPYNYRPKNVSVEEESTVKQDPSTVDIEVELYRASNDYEDMIKRLLSSPEESTTLRLGKYLSVLKAVDSAYPSEIKEFRDVSLLIWLLEICNNGYFKNWERITDWTKAVKDHFTNIAEGKMPGYQKAKPAQNLSKGYIVTHPKFGQGNVELIILSDSQKPKTAVVNFIEYGIKKFPIPESLKYFTILSEGDLPAEEVRSSLQCNIDSYTDWIAALAIINDNKEFLGKVLYDAIFGLLVEKLGLKAKFVEDRFKEKGWN